MKSIVTLVRKVKGVPFKFAYFRKMSTECTVSGRGGTTSGCILKMRCCVWCILRIRCCVWCVLRIRCCVRLRQAHCVVGWLRPGS